MKWWTSWKTCPNARRFRRLTNWPTLPKVFISGKFYGDTDVLGPMEESGELKTVLDEAFAGHAPVPEVIKLR